jgi:hypothetical protein
MAIDRCAHDRTVENANTNADRDRVHVASIRNQGNIEGTVLVVTVLAVVPDLLEVIPVRLDHLPPAKIFAI